MFFLLLSDHTLIRIFKFPFIEPFVARTTLSFRRGDLWSPGVGTEDPNIFRYKAPDFIETGRATAGRPYGELRWFVGKTER